MSADDESPIELFIVDIVNAVVWVDVCGETGGAASGCVEDDPETWSIIVGEKGREKSCGHSECCGPDLLCCDHKYKTIITTYLITFDLVQHK